jgi:hypothetical protein
MERRPVPKNSQPMPRLSKLPRIRHLKKFKPTNQILPATRTSLPPEDPATDHRGSKRSGLIAGSASLPTEAAAFCVRQRIIQLWLELVV